MRYQVLISGGGIAGLTLALKLVSHGVQVLVVEKEVEQPIKYKGELLQPKSLQIMDNLGISKQVLSQSFTINKTHLVEHFSSDSEITPTRITLDYSLLNASYPYAVMIPHETLKNIILQRAKTFPNFHMMQPARMLSIDHHIATIRTPDGDQQIEADYIIGAEGKVSIVRKKMKVSLQIQKYNHQFLTLAAPRPDSLDEAEVIYRNHRFLGLFPLPNEKVRIVYLIRSGELKYFYRNHVTDFHAQITRLKPEMQGYIDKINNWNQIELMVPQRHSASHYVQDHYAIIGDAAHSVHPMAGEGMNMAIQDADVLGELIPWLYTDGRYDAIGLKWYELVRKPRAEFISSMSHFSALAYSYPNDWLVKFRIKVLQTIQSLKYLQTQNILNISGIGQCPETIVDRLIQIGLLPQALRQSELNQKKYTFTIKDDYPWTRGNEK